MPRKKTCAEYKCRRTLLAFCCPETCHLPRSLSRYNHSHLKLFKLQKKKGQGEVEPWNCWISKFEIPWQNAIMLPWASFLPIVLLLRGNSYLPYVRFCALHILKEKSRLSLTQMHNAYGHWIMIHVPCYMPSRVITNLEVRSPLLRWQPMSLHTCTLCEVHV